MKKSILLLLVIVFITRLGSAQTAPIMYSVHEDIVKPSMNAKYRETVKKLKAACELHKLNFSWNSVAFDDGSFRHLSPIKGFAELEKNPFADLETKMGKEALGKLWAEFDECLESQSDFVMVTLPQFSYLSPTDADTHRDIMYWYPLPGKGAEAEAILAEWKKLYETKKTGDGYLVLRVAFGREQIYSIVSWGKDAADVVAKSKKTWEIIGDEGYKLWLRTLAITKRHYSKRADMLPDFSYTGPK